MEKVLWDLKDQLEATLRNDVAGVISPRETTDRCLRIMQRLSDVTFDTDPHCTVPRDMVVTAAEQLLSVVATLGL